MPEASEGAYMGGFVMPGRLMSAGWCEPTP